MPDICNKLNAYTRVPVFISVKEISNPQRVSEFATPQKQSQIFYYCNETTLLLFSFDILREKFKTKRIAITLFVDVTVLSFVMV